MAVIISLGRISQYLKLNSEAWITIIIGAIVTLMIAFIIYLIQKKESNKHKQDHDAKFDKLEQLHRQDSEKIDVLYNLLIKSQSSNLNMFQQDKVEKEIQTEAELITEEDSTHAQALKAIAENRKETADKLLDEIAAHEHDLEKLYTMRALNESRAGNYIESAKWYKKVVELEPGNNEMKQLYVSTLRDSGQVEESERIAHEVIKELEMNPKDNESELIYAYLNLGATYLHQYSPEAETWLEKSLDLSIKVNGESYPQNAGIMYPLGHYYTNIGEYQKAEDILRKAISIVPESDEENRYLREGAKVNLGVLMENIGKLKESSTLLEESYSFSSKYFGEEHPMTIMILQNLSCVYLNLQQYEKAEAGYLKALEIFSKVKVEDDSNLLVVNTNLSVLYYKMGKFDKSESIGRYILGIALKKHDRDSIPVSQILTSLARTCNSLGKKDEAYTYIKEVYENESKHTHHNSSYLGIMDFYSQLLLERNQLNEAEKIINELYEFTINQFGEDLRYQIYPFISFAELYEKMGKIDLGIDYYEKAMAIIEEKNLIGRFIPEINKYKSFLEKAGKIENAEQLQLKLDALQV